MESNSIYLAEYAKLQLDMIDTIREEFKKKGNMITCFGGRSLRVNDYFLFFRDTKVFFMYRVRGSLANIKHVVADILYDVFDVLHGAANICLPKTHFSLFWKFVLDFFKGKSSLFSKNFQKLVQFQKNWWLLLGGGSDPKEIKITFFYFFWTIPS